MSIKAWIINLLATTLLFGCGVKGGDSDSPPEETQGLDPSWPLSAISGTRWVKSVGESCAEALVFTANNVYAKSSYCVDSDGNLFTEQTRGTFVFEAGVLTLGEAVSASCLTIEKIAPRSYFARPYSERLILVEDEQFGAVYSRAIYQPRYDDWSASIVYQDSQNGDGLSTKFGCFMDGISLEGFTDEPGSQTDSADSDLSDVL